MKFMSAALRSTSVSRSDRRPHHQSPVRGIQSSVNPLARAPKRATPPKTSSSAVRTLPDSRIMPLWLQWLIKVQRSSSIATCLLAVAVLMVYGWTVYSQQLWSQQYHKLETLQHKERQLMTSSEVLKNQLAQQAERPTTGLVSPQPANLIFLKPAPERPLRPINPALAATGTAANNKTVPSPLGY